MRDLIRDLEKDKKRYHVLKFYPYLWSDIERVDTETYWHRKWKLDELRDYEVTLNVEEWVKPTWKSNVKMKYYNHLDNFECQWYAEQTKERDEEEEKWCEDRQDYILELNR